MVKPGPASKKKEVMSEILNLLSKKEYGFRELHRSLPRERRAGSFATLYACINLLRSQGYIDLDQETKKLRLTPEGDLERKKQPMIKEINEAKIIASHTSSSNMSPIRYEWNLAKTVGDGKSNFNRLYDRLRLDPDEANLFFLSTFLWRILTKGKNEEVVGGRQTLDDFWAGLRKDLPLDAVVLNVVSINVERLLAWLKTPLGIATLEYVLEQIREGRMENIERLANRSFPARTPPSSPYGYRIAKGKSEDAGNVENGGERLRTHEEHAENARRTRAER